jgi:hypothetical protein
MRKTILAACIAGALAAPALFANHFADLYILPVAARTTGFNNTPFRTDVSLQNFQTVPITVSFLFIQAGEGNPENITNLQSTSLPNGSVTIPAGGSAILTDVLDGFTGAGANPFGAILVSSDRPFAVSSRAYTPLATGGTYGQTVTPVRDFIENSLGDTNNAGATSYLPGLVHNTSFRTNLGFVAAAGENGMGIEVILRDAAGATLGTRGFNIPANTFVQTQFSVVSVANATFNAGSAEFRITTGDGAAAPYASIIDAVTADAVFVTGVFPPNNLSALSQSRAKSVFRKLVEQRSW